MKTAIVTMRMESDNPEAYKPGQELSLYGRVLSVSVEQSEREKMLSEVDTIIDKFKGVDSPSPRYVMILKVLRKIVEKVYQ
jgi:hypothetical protein